MVERYYYYDGAGYTACEEHMQMALEGWFPQVEGMGFETMIQALEDSEDLNKRNFQRLGTRMGPVDRYCNSIHY